MSAPKVKPKHQHHAHDVNEEHLALLSLVYRLSQENAEFKHAYQRLLKQSTQALMKTMELRDPYSYGHGMRVMEYTMMIGRGAGLKTSELRNLELSAMMHDIGKVGTPDCVLLKTDKLTPEEQIVMQEHPINSGDIVGIIDEFKNVVPGVKHHHERFDGKGYPSKLVGTEIPLASRIILVADTFDAMTSTRPYRHALPIHIAYEELERYAGTQFDPEFVKIFLEEHQKLMHFEPLYQKEKKAA